MKEQHAKRIVQDFAKQGIPGNMDLWPAIRSQLSMDHQSPPSRLWVRNLALAGTVLGLVLFGALVGRTVWQDSNNAAQSLAAAPSIGTGAPSSAESLSASDDKAQPPAKDALSKTPGNDDPLTAAFAKSFASHLGVDEAKVNAAFTAAVNDTLAQAVSEGKIDAKQADEVKAGAQGGFLKALNFKALLSGTSRQNAANVPAEAIAQALGMSQADFEQAIKSGKTLEQVAQEHNIPLDKLKASVAEQAAKIEAQRGAQRVGEGNAQFVSVGPLNVGANDLAKLLNISASQVEQELKTGKTVAQVAQAHNVSTATVKATLLDMVKRKLDLAVAGGMTQEQANNELQTVSKQLDEALSK